METPKTPPQSNHWKYGEELAYELLEASTEERKVIISSCEEQGILAGIVCLYLCRMGAACIAEEFINDMIASVEESL